MSTNLVLLSYLRRNNIYSFFLYFCKIATSRMFVEQNLRFSKQLSLIRHYNKEIMSHSKPQTLISLNNYFPVWFRIWPKKVVSHMEKSCIVSYYGQIFTMKIIVCQPRTSLAQAFRQSKENIFLTVENCLGFIDKMG